MPHVLKRLEVRAERGYSMFLVIMALTLTAMFVAAAFTAANGDLPVAGVATERKSDYAAAEAGLNYYLTRLQQDPDYWTKCDTEPAIGADKNPVNQVNATTKNWRKIPDSNDWYMIELLPARNYEVAGDTYWPTCDPKNQQSFVDQNTGTFRVRATGRVGTGENARKRSIIATFRRDSFLNFLWFTNYENRDPAAESDPDERRRQESVCADKYRSARASNRCTEIQFMTGDYMNGPMHTNDDTFLVCGTPSLGRTVDINQKPREGGFGDTVEVRGSTSPGYTAACTSSPRINTPTKQFTLGAKPLAMPTSNSALKDVAKASSSYYTGLTYVDLSGDRIWIRSGGSDRTIDWPTSGVLYIGTDATCTGEAPTQADYAGDSATCGNVYVSGTYSKSLTIAAENDVIVLPTGNNANPNITRVAGADATLGLIANNFVRVGHRVEGTCGINRSPVFTNIRIEAAILALKHSFIVDNYHCGGALNDLTVVGAIVQKYRGPVGTSARTGYLKDYWYDDRFRYRSPPYFLTPVAAAWDIVRSHEVVKG